MATDPITYNRYKHMGLPHDFAVALAGGTGKEDLATALTSVSGGGSSPLVALYDDEDTHAKFAYSWNENDGYVSLSPDAVFEGTLGEYDSGTNRLILPAGTYTFYAEIIIETTTNGVNVDAISLRLLNGDDERLNVDMTLYNPKIGSNANAYYANAITVGPLTLDEGTQFFSTQWAGDGQSGNASVHVTVTVRSV